MLEIEHLAAYYGRTQALFDVSMSLEKGRCLSLVGTNGAGKTTIIRAILGLVRTEGAIVFDGVPSQHMPTHRRVRDIGIGVVHEGRGLLSRMTVRENIVVGLRSNEMDGVDEAIELFPALKSRLAENVTNLSGGQQQMVALARAVARRPRLLLLDEPSLGLAPILVDEIYGYLGRLRATGLTMLLVEQSIERAAAFADTLCLIRVGRSISSIPSSDKSAVDELVASAFDRARAPSAPTSRSS